MKPLTAVARATAKSARADKELADAIRAAYASGETLRAIAAAANVSHEQVRRIIQKGD